MLNAPEVLRAYTGEYLGKHRPRSRDTPGKAVTCKQGQPRPYVSVTPSLLITCTRDTQNMLLPRPQNTLGQRIPLLQKYTGHTRDILPSYTTDTQQRAKRQRHPPAPHAPQNPSAALKPHPALLRAYSEVTPGLLTPQKPLGGPSSSCPASPPAPLPPPPAARKRTQSKDTPGAGWEENPL